jgi:hypothetical protein
VTQYAQAVRCGSCGSDFDLSARNVRAWQSRGQEPVCGLCRRKPKPVDGAQLERMKLWWLEPYSLDELVEIGRLIGWC